jgi:hypothetical protein
MTSDFFKDGVGSSELPTESNGAIAVNVQDQHSELVDLHLTQLIDTMTITSDRSVGDTTIPITCDTLPVVGNIACLKEGTAFYQGEVLSFTGTGPAYTLTVDNPLDFDYTTAGGCSLRTENLNVVGSHGSPQIFSISPAGLVDADNPLVGQRWDVVRVLFGITDATAMDDGMFGSIEDGLTNGIVIRKKNGTYKNIFNVKTNGDFALHTYDTSYIPDTQGPGGLFGFRCRRTFGGQSKNGVTVRLNADDDDEFQVLVQDDLTGLNSFKVVVQGHVVQD